MDDVILLVTSWEKWTAIGTLALAGATVLLGLMTLGLVLATKRMVERAGEQLALERTRMELAQRPRVFPAPPAEWTDGSGRYSGRWVEVLPVKNGGPGVALNVQGQLNLSRSSGAGGVQILSTSLGPGDFQDLRINWGARPVEDWNGASGWLDYEDIAGARWRTNFRVYAEVRRYIHVRETTLMMRPDGSIPPPHEQP